MRRLCFLVPDVDSAHRVVDELRSHGVADAHLYVIARKQTELGDLSETAQIDESDFYPQLERGLAMGGIIGVIGGLIAIRVAGMVFGGAAILLFGLLGAGASGLLAAMAGSAFPNSRLTKFERAIENGEVLVMVDTPLKQVRQIEQLVKFHHPEAEIEGFEPRTPPIPGHP